MIETKITLTIKHTSPLPDLCDLVAGRAYTLSHVEDVTAEVGPQAEAVPPGVVVDKGFRWDGKKQQHIPSLTIEFEPVPANSPCDAQGWCDRDQVAEMFAAAPKPHQPPKPSPNEWVLE